MLYCVWSSSSPVPVNVEGWPANGKLSLLSAVTDVNPPLNIKLQSPQSDQSMEPGGKTPFKSMHP